MEEDYRGILEELDGLDELLEELEAEFEATCWEIETKGPFGVVFKNKYSGETRVILAAYINEAFEKE